MSRTVFASCLALVALPIAVACGFVALYHFGFIGAFPAGAQQIELVSVFLAAATLAVTALAVAIAVLGAVGYASIKAAAVESGRAAGEEAGRKAAEPFLARARLAAIPGPGDDGLTQELSPRE